MRGVLALGCCLAVEHRCPIWGFGSGAVVSAAVNPATKLLPSPVGGKTPDLTGDSFCRVSYFLLVSSTAVQVDICSSLLLTVLNV